MKEDYLILARKLRPEDFDGLIGQKHVVETIKNALEKGKIAQAYLFSGPRGVGKTTAARVLSKAINCEKGISSKPCCECSSCKAISESRFQDVIEIDGASNRGVDDIRSIRENLLYTPVSRERIYIIDEVHMLTKEAFNALLKTLEEPPPNTRFIFATTEPEKVPQTIISRCQRFDFKLVGDTAVFDYLKIVSEKENINISEEALNVIVRKAQGSVRDSLSLLEQISVYSDIDEKKAREILGEVSINSIKDIIKALSDHEAKEVLLICDSIIREGYQPNDIAHSLALALYDSLKKTSDDTPSNRLGIDRTLRALELLSSFLDVNSKLSPKIRLEILLARIARMVDTKSVKDLILKYENINHGDSFKEAEPAVKNPDQQYSQMLKEIENENKVVYHYLVNSTAEVKNESLVITLPNPGFVKLLQNKGNSSVIQKASLKIWKRDLKIVFLQGPAENEADNDENVKKIKNLFGGEVIEIN
ncbi:DNA polymerase III subunit gamma/tau [candidate division WOR-3 bacterium]|nr:DNA polymerase III subunit gamma/tau [candidate division WOR-3 bacterium]